MPLLASSVASTIAAFIILGCFVAIEPLTRKSSAAKSLRGSATDRGSTRLIGIAFGLGIALLLLTFALNTLDIGFLSAAAWLGWVGIVAMLVGLALRLWSTRTLGAYFTRTLTVAAEQPIIRGGPYQLVRHPGYLADLLLWIGAASATRNALVMVAVALLMVGAYMYRIRREEAMLRDALGAPYVAYMARTKRLIPFVY